MFLLQKIFGQKHSQIKNDRIIVKSRAVTVDALIDALINALMR